MFSVSTKHQVSRDMQFSWLPPSYKNLTGIIRTQLLPLGLKDEEIMTVQEANREFISPLDIT